MSDLRYTMRIDVDKHASGLQQAEKAEDLLWLVSIFREDDSLVGVPLRAATYEDAVRFQSSLKFAFNYGLNEAKKQIQHSLWNTRFDTQPAKAESEDDHESLATKYLQNRGQW